MIYLRALLEQSGLDAAGLSKFSRATLDQLCADRNVKPCLCDDMTADAWTKLQASVRAGQRASGRTTVNDDADDSRHTDNDEADTMTRVVPTTLQSCTVLQLRTILNGSGAISQEQEGSNKAQLIRNVRVQSWGLVN